MLIMEDECESLSKTDRNRSFSGRKKKKKTFKPVLMPSKPTPLKGLASATSDFNELLERRLPCARISDSDSGDQEAHRGARTSLALGANAVNRMLQNKNLRGVLFTADLNPETLVAHIIQRCTCDGVPMLRVDSLRAITKQTLGFECIALGFKKSSDIFKDVIEKLQKETNTVVDVTLESQIEEIVLNDEESVMIIDEKPIERIFSCFTRSDPGSRVFNPENYIKERGIVNEPNKSDKDFISIQNQSFVMVDEAPKGISTTILKNSLKRKNFKQQEQPLKKNKSNLGVKKGNKGTAFVPAKVKKIGSNQDRKQKFQKFKQKR